MIGFVNNYKLKIFIILSIGFIVISTITAISMYTMYQYYFSNDYKYANRIIRLYERSYNDINKDLEYLKLIDFKKDEKDILKSFETISKIIYEKNRLVNGIVLIKQFNKNDLQKEEAILQKALDLTDIKIRPINKYLVNGEKVNNQKFFTTVYHREPEIYEKDIRGVDVSTENSRYKTVSKMNFSGNSYLSAPLAILNGSKGHENSTILYYPLYKVSDSNEYYKWFLAVPITYQNLIDKLKTRYSFIDNFIIQLYDYEFSKKDLLCEDKEENCSKKFIKLTDYTFNFAGRDNTIVVGINSIYTLEKFWQPILGFTSGIVFLILIGYYLLYKERKDAQVSKLKLQIQKAQKISQIGHFSWNITTNKFTCSDEIVEMLELEKNPISLDELKSKYYKNDYNKSKKILIRLIKKTIEPEGQFEYRVLIDGQIKWLLTKYNAIYTNSGELKDVFGVTQDITEFKTKESLLKKQTEEFKKLAIIDRLTNIYNRSHFDEQLDNHLEQFTRYNKIFSIILLDIDHFKFINDHYGHDMGDQVLVTLANLVKTSVRKADVFARWGGEEFVVLLPNINLEQASIVAEKLRKSIKEYNFSDKFRITSSFGVTQVKENDNPKELFKRVDILLYEAKGAGRDTVIKG